MAAMEAAEVMVVLTEAKGEEMIGWELGGQHTVGEKVIF